MPFNESVIKAHILVDERGAQVEDEEPEPGFGVSLGLRVWVGII